MIHNKLTTGFTAFAVIFSLMMAGCNSGSFNQGEASLDTNIDSVSYAFGFLNGKQMQQQGMDDLDPDVFSQAMQRALNEDSSAIPRSKMMGMLRRYQMKAQQKMQKKQQEEGKNNKQKGEAFLKKNKSKDGVKTTDSGLQYKILDKGDGASPTAKDTVVVNYAGTLLDGTTFDSNDSVSIPLNGVITGWTEGIQLMHEGASYKFWIPGELAYGAHPRPGGPIGPNQTLIFKVDLLKVKK